MPLSTDSANLLDDEAPSLEDPARNHKYGIERGETNGNVENHHKKKRNLVIKKQRQGETHQGDTHTYKELGKDCIDQVMVILLKGFKKDNTNKNAHHKD